MRLQFDLTDQQVSYLQRLVDFGIWGGTLNEAARELVRLFER